MLNMTKFPLHLDLIALDLVWADPKANLKLMDQAISKRLSESSSLALESRIFVFPELTLTAFVTENTTAVALERASAEVQALRDLAKKHGVAIVAGFPEKVAGQAQPYNTLLVISPQGEDLADYQKMHLYTASQPPESATYQRGTTGTLLHYRGWRIGFGICFDVRFSAMFHAYAREGADLVILPSCWIGGPGKSDQLRTLSAARAIEGQCFFAALNRSGQDPKSNYEGEVLCFGPRGEAMADQAGFGLNPALLDQARQLFARPSDLEDYPVVMIEGL